MEGMIALINRREAMHAWKLLVGHAADIIARYNIALDSGPTRHGITRGQTIYFFDPSGNPTRVWTADEMGKSVFYYEKELNDRLLGVVT